MCVDAELIGLSQVIEIIKLLVRISEKLLTANILQGLDGRPVYENIRLLIDFIFLINSNSSPKE